MFVHYIIHNNIPEKHIIFGSKIDRTLYVELIYASLHSVLLPSVAVSPQGLDHYDDHPSHSDTTTSPPHDLYKFF